MATRKSAPPSNGRKAPVRKRATAKTRQKKQTQKQAKRGNGKKPPVARSAPAGPSGLYIRHLAAGHAPEGMVAVWEAAAEASKADSLDTEITLARCMLDWALSEWTKSPTGGVIISSGDKVIRERLWIDIVGDATDRVRNLVIQKAQNLKTKPTDGHLDTYKEWLALRSGS